MEEKENLLHISDESSIYRTIPCIKDLLKTENAGQHILKIYEKNSELNEKNRNKMCDIIMSYLGKKQAK